MRKLILGCVAMVFALTATGQETVKLLTSGKGENVKEAGDAAISSAMELCRTALVPDTVAVNLDGIITERKIVRSSFTGGKASTSLLVTLSLARLSKLLEEKGVSCDKLSGKALRMQRANTSAAFEEMYTELEAMAPDIFDASVEFTNINPDNMRVGQMISWTSNDHTERFCTLLHNYLTALSLTQEENDWAIGQGQVVYETDYFLNVPEYDIKEGTATIKRNIRHYGKELLSGFTYEDNAITELYFLAPLDIKRLKSIFLIGVNSFRITDAAGNIFITNLCDDFMDVLFVDDFAKNITNIAFWDVPLSTKFDFEGQYGVPKYQLGQSPAAFFLPKDYPYTEVTGLVRRLKISSTPTAPGSAPVIYQHRYDLSTYTYYKLYPRLD